MKYFVFLFVLMFSSVGCAVSWHYPTSYVEYEYVYVPSYKKRVITYRTYPTKVYKKKVYHKKMKRRKRTIIRKDTYYHYH